MSEKSRLAFIQRVKEFGERELSLQFDSSFVSFTPKLKSAYWLYVVQSDRLVSALPGNATFCFSWNRRQAERWERGWMKKGFHTYLYTAEAHGGRRCPVTPALLSAATARQVYVVLHEGWHSTLRLSGIRMPYALEEATGRVVGVQGAVMFADKIRDLNLRSEAMAQASAWASFVRFVNSAHRRLDRARKDTGGSRAYAKALNRAIGEAGKLWTRMPDSWEREEIRRADSGAYFYRYYDYTKYYPLAQKVFRASGSLPRAMKAYVEAGSKGALLVLRGFTDKGKQRIYTI